MLWDDPSGHVPCSFNTRLPCNLRNIRHRRQLMAECFLGLESVCKDLCRQIYSLPALVTITMNLMVDALPESFGCCHSILTPHNQTSSRLIFEKGPHPVLLKCLSIRIWYDGVRWPDPVEISRSSGSTIGHG